MSKLLYIESSPRKKRSTSIAIAHLFLEEYRKTHPQDEIQVIDLWHKELPPFDGDVIDSKYAIMHGQNFTENQVRAWKAVEDIITEFKSADKHVFSLPMWNFLIPYKLKHYIDLLVQPGYTFSYSPEAGYKGLVVDKPITLIYSRGGAYGAETGMSHADLQIRYMETILGFIGFKDFKSIVLEPMLAAPDIKEKALKKAQEDAIKAAAKF